MRLSALKRRAVEQVARNMREWDHREICATRPDGNEITSLIDDVFKCGPVSWVAYNDLCPVAVFGCAPAWRGVWSMWFFATNDFHKIGLGVTKLVIQHIVPMLWEGGAHRLQCYSMEGHVDAHRWLNVIGAKRDGTLPGYGRDGENFHVYSWEKPDVLRG